MRSFFCFEQQGTSSEPLPSNSTTPRAEPRPKPNPPSGNGPPAKRKASARALSAAHDQTTHAEETSPRSKTAKWYHKPPRPSGPQQAWTDDCYQLQAFFILTGSTDAGDEAPSQKEISHVRVARVPMSQSFTAWECRSLRVAMVIQGPLVRADNIINDERLVPSLGCRTQLSCHRNRSRPVLRADEKMIC